MEESPLDEAQEMHSKLRKYKYYYYNLHQSLVEDYEFDMLEKKYDRLCDDIGIRIDLRVSSKVGWDNKTPMDLNNFYTYNKILNFCIFKD